MNQTSADLEGIYQNPPIFVLGHARSGTTLMQLMLSAHPRIFITFELSFYNWLPMSRRVDTAEEFLEQYFTTGGFQWLGIAPERINERLPSPLAKEDLWLAFREMMVLKASGYGCPRWGDKTPGHLKQLGKIYRDFPDAKVILMVRDPRTAVPSTARMPWGSTSDWPNCMSYEGSYNKSKAFLERVLMVRLEDLQEDPRGQMARVLNFVGEPWDEAVLEHKHHNPDPQPIPPLPWLESSRGPVQTQTDNERRLSPVRTRAIEKMCRRSMHAYGYERADLIAEPGNRMVRRHINSSVGETLRYLRAALRFFLYIRRPGHMSWDDPRMQELFRRVNPSCWERYPDFVWPTRTNTEVTKTVEGLGLPRAPQLDRNRG